MPAPSAIAPTAGPSFSPASIPGSTAATGGGGTLVSTPISTIKGFSIAFNDPALAENPAWTWIDDPAGTYKVQGIDVDRGRSYELDKNQTGTATVRMVDLSGVFDSTNSTSPFFGKLEPMKQAAVAVYNPVATTWQTVFRGFISDWRYVVDVSELFTVVEIDLVDAQDVLAAIELVPDGTFGNQVLNGDIIYNEDLGTNSVQTRTNKVLDECSWPAGLRSIFTGNVKVQRTPYPVRASALSVILDAWDAEHPVANVYVSKVGKVSTRGRLARFNPTNPTYGITTWLAGDAAATTASPSTVCQIVEPFAFYRDKENVFPSAVATPQGINDADIPGQVVKDAFATATFGRRTWSAENLLTAGGTGTTALVETKKFATYIVNNYKAPLTRVPQLTVNAALTSGQRASLEWTFVSGVELGDRIQLKTTHAGGGGFNNSLFFVEGLHYVITPLNDTHNDVVVTVDLSPAGYWAFPF